MKMKWIDVKEKLPPGKGADQCIVCNEVNGQRDAIVHNNLVDMVGQQDADFLEAAGLDDIGCKD